MPWGGLFVAGLAVSLALTAQAAAQDNPPLPPPPFAPDQGLAQPDQTLRALSGEWRLRRSEGRTASDGYTLTIWGSAFAAGRACAIAQGQLRALGGGRYRIERYGPTPERCRRLNPPEPFDQAELRLSGDRRRLSIRSPDGREWLFVWVDVEATRASDDFLRGDWLLADVDGDPYRAAELTRVSFGERGYSVRAANCNYQVNGYLPDRDWVVRPGGSQYVQTQNCRPRTLGDLLAQAGDRAKLIAEPVEGRIRVTVDRRTASLVPAARFPELSEGSKSYPANAWARQLAELAARLPPEQRSDLLVQVLPKGDALVGSGTNALNVAFSGYSIAEMDRLALAGLPTGGIARPIEQRSLEELLLSVPIAAVAELEAVEPVDRGDGLSLDYRYRVVEGWRGGKRTGDLLIARMPPLLGKSRSPLITPERGARVLLLASRLGYLAATLRNGKPPSIDQRVVAMTLPLLRVTDGRLAEAQPGADVLGSARFAGMPLAEARARARALDAHVSAALTDLQGKRRFRYFVTHIGPRALPDPTRYWIDYGADLPASSQPGRGAVIAWSDGCLTRTGRSYGAAPPIRTCPQGKATAEPAIARAAKWIDAHGIPEAPSIGDPVEPFAAIAVPSTPSVTIRGTIQ